MMKTDPIRLEWWKFANPFCDRSSPSFWEEEIKIIERLLNGEELILARLLVEDEWANSYFWSTNLPPYSEAQYDVPVIMLLGRQIIRPVRCAGGMTWLLLTDHARSILESTP